VAQFAYSVHFTLTPRANPQQFVPMAFLSTCSPISRHGREGGMVTWFLSADHNLWIKKKAVAKSGSPTTLAIV
jgi:hypothetical protein